MRKKLSISIIFLLQFLSFSRSQQTLSSVEWDLKKNREDLKDREYQILDFIGIVLPEIEYQTENAAFPATVTTSLTKVSDLLRKFATQSNYPDETVALTCNGITIDMKNINTIYIPRTTKTKSQVDVNNTNLLAQTNSFTSTYLASYNSLTLEQKHVVNGLRTWLMMLVDSYQHYSLSLASSITKYSRSYIHLDRIRKTFCSCPSAMSTSSSAHMKEIDKQLKRIETTIGNVESRIRKTSEELPVKIGDSLSTIYNNEKLLKIYDHLSAALQLSNRFVKTSNIDNVNSTENCEDASIKVAFIQYKIDKYFYTSIEARKNLTNFLIQVNSLNFQFKVLRSSLTSDEFSSLKSVISSSFVLVHEFVQYILAKLVSWQQLSRHLDRATKARTDGCSCSGKGAATSTTTTTSTSSKIP